MPQKKMGSLGVDQLAAVIVEPVAANMGLVAPAPGFLEGLRTACDASGSLLIFDEVITGFRLARGGAAERERHPLLLDPREDLPLDRSGGDAEHVHCRPLGLTTVTHRPPPGRSPPRCAAPHCRGHSQCRTRFRRAPTRRR
mgnify:CR=1 FL=1